MDSPVSNFNSAFKSKSNLRWRHLSCEMNWTVCHDGWLRCGNLSSRTVAYRYAHHNVYPPLSVFQATWNLFSLCNIFKQHLPQLCLCMWVENYVRVRRAYDEVLATPSVNLSLECSCDIAYLRYHSNSPLHLCSVCRHRVNIILSII